MSSDLDVESAEAPLAHRAVKGGLWVALSSYWTIGFGFLVNIGLMRVLPAEAFGQFAYAMFFVQLLSVSPKLGLKYAFVQQKRSTKEVLGTYIALEILAVLGTLLLTVLAIPVLPSSVLPTCVAMAVAGFASLGGIGGLLLEKELRLGRTSLIDSIVIPVSYIPAFVVAYQGGGVWSLVSQVVSQRLLTFAAYGWLAGRHFPGIWTAWRQFDVSLAREYLITGLSVGASTYVSSLTATLDSFLIGRFVGETTLGYYDRARRTASWPSTLLTNMVSRTSLYTYAKIQDDPVRLDKAVSMVTWLVGLLALPIALAIYVSAPEIVMLLYGEQWLPSVPYLGVLVFVSSALPIVENLGTLFTATGSPRVVLWSAILQVVIMAGVGLPMTLSWGALGTAIATGIAILLRLLWLLRVVARRMRTRLHVALLLPIAAGVLTLGLYTWIDRSLFMDRWHQVVRLLIQSMTACVLYLGISFLLQPRAIRERVRYIWQLLHG